MKIGNTYLNLDKPVVMAILNVTPDSFFPGSRKFSREAVAGRVEEIVSEGADMIDLGGYSTRPGAPEVSPEEELRRVSLGMEVIRETAPDIPVSIDTFRSSVAEGVLSRFGDCIVNDISAGEIDPGIIDAAAKYGVPYIAMHMRGTPVDMQQFTQYGDVAEQVKEYLFARAASLEDRGVRDVILDPGFGFSKTTEQNYELLAGLGEICAGRWPVLAGVSRKSMIYKVLGNTPADSLAGTTALNWECLCAGAKILRVHDVAPAADIVKLFNYYTEHGA